MQDVSTSARLARRMMAAGAVTLALTGAGLVSGAPGASASMATHRYSGTIVAVRSASRFSLRVGMHRYVVTVDAMTHVRLNGKSVKLRSLHAGEHAVVAGHLHGGDITATSVAAHGM